MNEELKIFISAEIADLKKNMQSAQDEVKELETKGGSGFKKFGEAAKAAGTVVANGMKIATAAVAAGAAALVALSESTKEYRTNQAKLVSAFESAGAGAEEATAAYNDLYRVLGDDGQATEAAAHLAQLTTNEQELAEWTNVCQGVYATFGDSLPIEGLTEAANETAKVGTVTGSLADALNWAGISEDAFNEKLAACNTEAEREKLIRETLTGIYDEASASYEKNAKSILDANAAQAKLTSGLASLGAAAEPIVTIFKDGLGNVLQELVPHFETVSQGLQDIINGVDGGAEKMSAGITGLISTIADTITNLLPTVIPMGVEIIKAMLNGIISALPTLIKSIVDAIPSLIQGIVDAFGAIVDALPSIIETIVNALPTLIPALITGIVTMVVTLCEKFGEIIQPIIDALPDIIISIVEAIVTNLPILIDGIISLVLSIVEAIPQIIQGLVDALPTVISLLIQALLNNLPQIIEGLIQVVIGVVQSLPQIFGSLIEGIVNIFAGIWDGLGEVFGNVGGWFEEKFDEAVGAIKGVFDGIGAWFGGIWEDIKANFSEIGNKIGEAVSNAFNKAVNWVLEKAIGIINGFITAINYAIDIINLIPGVELGKISLLEVPKLAKGGIIDSATLAVVGEQGKEAVMPLENNTEWMDILADRLAARNGAPSKIVLTLDGRELGQATINSINSLTRQTGKLQLALV